MNKSLELDFLAHTVRQCRLLIFTKTGSVSKTKHNLTYIRKLVKSCKRVTLTSILAGRKLAMLETAIFDHRFIKKAISQQWTN